MYYNAYSVRDGMNTSTNSKVITPHRVTPTPDGDFLLFLGKRVRQLRSLRGMTRKMVAREADGDERAALWPRVVAVFTKFEELQADTERRIPVVVLEPA